MVYRYSVKYCDPKRQASILELLMSNHKSTLNISIVPTQGRQKRCGWCGLSFTTFSATHRSYTIYYFALEHATLAPVPACRKRDA